MSDSKPNSSSQAIQTVLVVLVSVLLTALLVLLFGKKINQGSSANLQENSSYEAAGIESVSELAAKISKDSEVLEEKVAGLDRALKTAIDEKENAFRARDGYTDQVFNYKQQIDELGTQLASAKSLMAENQLLVDQLNNEKLNNEALQKQVTQHLLTIQELRDSDDSLQLIEKNNQLQAELDRYKKELSTVEARINELERDREELQLATAQAIAYKQENEKLRKQLADLNYKYNRDSLFVKEATSIDPRVTALYNSLVALKGQSGDELGEAYTALQSRLNVRKLRHVKFAEGSAFVSDLEGGLIGQDVATAAEDSFLLVVGYASTTGSADANYQLSAKRATAVASAVYGKKAAEQDVKAVFLGQTSRFSPELAAENQVCEIWEIIK